MSLARGDEWCTPDELLDLVRKVAPIGLDPCSQPSNPTGAAIFAVAPGRWPADEDLPSHARIDGLSFPWLYHCPDGSLVFANYPYSNPEPWVDRCRREGEAGGEVIALGQLDTSTNWWRDHCLPATGRVSYGPPCCAHERSRTAHDPVSGACRSDGCKCKGWTGRVNGSGSGAVCFWHGRMTFKGAPGPARFACFVAYWGPRPARFAAVFHVRGAIWI